MYLLENGKVSGITNHQCDILRIFLFICWQEKYLMFLCDFLCACVFESTSCLQSQRLYPLCSYKPKVLYFVCRLSVSGKGVIDGV